MQFTMTRRALALAAFAAAALAACGGGGGSDVGPKQTINRMVVAGDSLADVGVFGAKFTVQNAANPAAGYPVFPELVGQAYGLSGQCSFFASANGGASFTTRSGCANFAVGGGHIVNPAAQGGAAAPFSLPVQLNAAAASVGGAYGANDLVLVVSGGNDAADLVAAYLGLASGAPGLTAYQTFLAQQLDPATIAATLPQANGTALAAGLYMQKLADTYFNTVKAATLDKGATHVAMLDIVDITLTPRFRGVLAQVAAAQGASAAATLQATIQTWIKGFNTQLVNRAAGDARVAIVPFFADTTEEVNNPAMYGLTNSTTAACSDTGFPSTCVDASLNAAPPAGLAANWWSTWVFSNSFHPSPYGHRLLASSVNRALARAGWL